MLATLLTTPLAREEIPSVLAWRDTCEARVGDLSVPIDRALVAGLHADRVGYAFAAGYQIALHVLAPGLERSKSASFCATERGSAHPRAMATTLDPDRSCLVVSGEKTFSTMASDADVLFVVAARGTSDSALRQLALVRVPARAPGVHIENVPTLAFIPEITHARVTFARVAVAPEDVFPGDGYVRYLKPFRTLEDLYVHAAILGHLARIARLYEWPHDALEGLLVLAAAVRALGEARVEAVTTHVALAGVLASTRRWLDENDAHWAVVEPLVRERWRRDLPLLGIAEPARMRRTVRAWERLVPVHP